MRTRTLTGKFRIKGRKTARMVIGIALFITFGYIVLNGYYVWPHVGIITIPEEYQQPMVNLWNNTANPIPAYSAHFTFTFSAVGSVSLNNPVNVTVTVSSVLLNHTGVKQFSQYYYGVGLTEAFNPTTVRSSKPVLASIPLRDEGNGTWYGKGQVVWLQDGPTVPFLTPNGNWYVTYSDLQSFGSVLNIAPNSDTLSIQTSLNNQRLTFILIGFSVLMLQPVFEAVFRLGSD